MPGSRSSPRITARRPSESSSTMARSSEGNPLTTASLRTGSGAVAVWLGGFKVLGSQHLVRQDGVKLRQIRRTVQDVRPRRPPGPLRPVGVNPGAGAKNVQAFGQPFLQLVGFRAVGQLKNLGIGAQQRSNLCRVNAQLIAGHEGNDHCGVRALRIHQVGGQLAAVFVLDAQGPVPRRQAGAAGAGSCSSVQAWQLLPHRGHRAVLVTYLTSARGGRSCCTAMITRWPK